jgi:MFS transporter, DHA1 family, multidrug resistance protein
MRAIATRWQRLLVAGSLPRSVLLASVFCEMTGVGMVWSILAVFATTLGASATMVGAMVSVFGGARVVASFPSGIASERFGRRRVMIVGLVFLTLSSFAAVGVTSVPVLMLFVVCQGIGEGMFLTAAMAAVADLSTQERRVRDMATYQGAALAGMSIGPGIDGLAAAAWGFGAPFLLQGLFSILALAAMIWVLPRDGARRPGMAGRAIPNVRPSFRLMAGLAAIAYGVYFSRVAGNWLLLPLIAKDTLGMSIAEIGSLYTLGAASNLLVLPIVNLASSRFGRMPVLIGATVVMLASLTLLAEAGSPATAWLAAALMGISTGLAAPNLAAYAIDAAPPGGIGAATGTLRTCMDLAFVTAPVIVGIIIDRLGAGYGGGLLFAGLLLTTAMLTFWLSRRGGAAPRSATPAPADPT